VAIGRILGYPEPVIQEWCDTFLGDSLFEEMSDDTVNTILGEISTVFDILDVDPSGFVDYMLPYKTPVSVDDGSDEVFSDVRQFLRDGITLSYEYDSSIFPALVEDYKTRQHY
jgi:hypothetical protein